jgi:hypothetical protein
MDPQVSYFRSRSAEMIGAGQHGLLSDIKGALSAVGVDAQLSLKRPPANLLAACNDLRFRCNNHEPAGAAELMQLAGIGVRQ